MSSFASKFKSLFSKKQEQDNLRPNLKAPVIGFDKKGHPVKHYYMDIQGERDYSKNKNIKLVAKAHK